MKAKQVRPLGLAFLMCIGLERSRKFCKAKLVAERKKREDKSGLLTPK